MNNKYSLFWMNRLYHNSFYCVHHFSRFNWFHNAIYLTTLVILIIFRGPKISIHGHAVNDNTWADILIECMNRFYITSNLEIRLKNPFHLIKILSIGSLVSSKTHFTWIMTSVVIKFNISSEHVMMNINAWLYFLLCI